MLKNSGRRGIICLLMALSIFSFSFFLSRPADAAVVSATLSPAADADITNRTGREANNSGASIDMRVTSRPNRDERALSLFDLSSIPAGATVEAGELSLYVTRLRDGARTYNVHRLTNSWLEGSGNNTLNSLTVNGVTWYERQYGDNLWTGADAWDWAAPGGDFIAAPSASLTTLPVVGARMAWDLTADVQTFTSGVNPNYGWLLKDSAEGSAIKAQVGFATKEDATPANWPQLIVTYVIGSTTIAPSGADANIATPFTLTLSNTGGPNGDEISQATFTIPAGYTNIPTTAPGYAITAPGGKNWTVTGLPAGATGPQTVTLSATSGADDLAGGENLQISFTATAPSATGPTSWDSSLTGAAGGLYYPPAQVVNITDGVAPDTVITAPLGGTLSGSNQIVTGSATDNVAVNAVDVAISRGSDGLYWNGSVWVAGPIWNSATITSGQGNPSAAWQYNWTLPPDNGGGYTIQARAVDAAANVDPTPAGVTVNVDNTAPQPVSLTINNNDTYTINNNVTLDTSATEATEMRFAESTAALSSASYIAYSPTSAYNLSGGDGQKTVYAQYRDAYGNETTPGAANTTDAIKLDATAPLVDIVNPANGSNTAGPSTTVTASFNEANSMDEVTINAATFYLLDGNNAVVTATISYNPVNKTATLTPAALLIQGMTYTANITTGVKDAAGNPMTVPYSWTFTVADSTAPDTAITDPSGGVLTGSDKIVTGSASDNLAVSSVEVAVTRDVDGYYWNGSASTWTAGPTWNSATITSGQNTPSAAWQYSWALPNSDGGGFTIQARAHDGGGNIDPIPAAVAVTVDNLAPVIDNFTIDSGAAYTTTTAVTLNSLVTDATEQRFAESTATLAGQSWQPYTADTTFTLSAGDGQKTVYAQYRDNAGNSTPIGPPGASDGIILDRTRPTVAATFPANGATGVNVSDVITATFTEANQMDAATINDTNFYLQDSGNTTVTASVTYNSSAKIASLTPTSALSFDTTYTARLTTAVADAAGNTLATEKIWSFKTAPPSTHPPGAPTDLAVTAGDMVNSLSWTPPAPGSDIGGDFDPLNNKGGYNVYRSPSPSGPWTKLNGALILTTSYNDISFGVKGYYYYLVRAVDLGGSAGADSSVVFNRYVNMSKPDNTSSATILDAANGLLTLNVPAQSAVTTITARTLTTSTPAGVTPVTDVFDLGPNGTNFSPPINLTFKTPGDPSGAKIRYWDGAGWREVSGGNYTYDVPNRMVSYDNITYFSYYTVTNNNDSTPPSAPGTLTVSAPVDGQLKLDWSAATDLESGISGYIIYRSLSLFDNSTKGSLAQVVATPGNVLTYTDNNVIKGETYYYGVSAANGAGLEGMLSNVSSATVTGKENAHKNYSSNTNLCRDCHVIHESPASTRKLARKAPEIENCYVCHDGTGSDFNIRDKFANLAAHDTSMTVSTGGVTTKCTECHSPHGIGNTWSTRLAEENLCYKCHNSTTSSANGWNIQQQFSQASNHSVTTTTADGLTGSVLECTSCHGPHGNKAGSGITDITSRLSDPFNTFNLWGGSYNDFCISCHRGSGWPEATATISAFVPYSIAFPLVTAWQFFPGWDKSAYTGSPAGHSADYTCQTCHSPHGSPNQRLLAYFDGLTYDTSVSTSKEENLCYQCHKLGGPAGAKDLLSQFAKVSRHPVETTETHSDLDTTATLGDTSRHAECVDCHDVHKAKAGTHAQGANAVSGVLNGIIGVAVTNGSAGATPSFSPTTISYEYELCFKCHSAYVNLPFAAKDKAVEFNFNNPSFHPVESTGANSGIDSGAFVGGWSATSKMYCSDCHTTDDPVSTTTPSGPHGSSFGWILKADFNKYNGSAGGNELCYECHSYSAYFGASAATRFWDDTTTTSEHKTHVGDRKAPCYACHDTHGRSDNAHLIRIKEAGETTGTTSFIHNAGGGACQATCHNQPLTNYTYKHKY